jgi:hypothetical protein
MTRTDIHRPGALEFDPQAYEYRGAFDLQSQWENRPRVEAIGRLLDEGYKFGHGGGGQCGHCGTRIRYAALLARPDVKEFIYVGEQCLDNRFELAQDEFHALRLAGKLNRERSKKIEKIEALVQAHPLLADLTYPEALDSNFLTDVGQRFTDKGILSDRQVEAAERVLLAGIERRAKRVAEQAVRLEQAPTLVFLGEVGDKFQVTGKIRFRKYLDGFYGTTTLIILDVETEQGPAVVKWFASKCIEDIDKGQEITLKGTIKANEVYEGQKTSQVTRCKIL